MSLLPKSIHRCRRYPTKFNSGRDIPHGYEFPDSTFITGHSMGGGISLATIEYYPQYYHGALPKT